MRLAGDDAFARARRVSAALAAADSATALLERRCGGPIFARAAAAAAAEATPAQRARLCVGAREPVVFRAVRLVHGERVLCEARNWYVPGRLDAQVLAALADGATPFGRAAARLAPARRTIASTLLFDAACPAPPWGVLRHQALVIGPAGAICEVEELFTRDVLAFF
ncbi:hypothetical protein [Methylocella sp.]|uniref:hypothetical protein n=1 Tax=Methylocella sp. TaxID=1978226 RepID=UPI00378421D3